MGISKFYTTNFSVYRQVWANESSGQSWIVGFSGHIQQASPNEVANLADIHTITHKIWCPVDTNVEAGDRLYSGGNSYTVRAINKRDYAGKNKHLQLWVEADLDFVSA